MGLVVEGLVKRFGDVTAVDGVSFSVEPGELLCLLGPSGCGKTTTLRCVAGLEAPDAGIIRLDGRVLADGSRGVRVPPHRRRFGMVFQSYAVWPHLTVFENVRYPLRFGARLSREEMSRRTRAALASVRLDEHAERFPHQLSGGQQQRVALARALVMEPAALLFDEPLSNLDAKLREEMRSELAEVQGRLKVPVLYVTHDQTEAMALATRIAVMDRGWTRQIGTPAEIYREPADEFVATFLGSTNLLPGRVEAHEGAAGARVRTAAGMLQVFSPEPRTAGDRVVVGIRPEHLVLHLQRPPGDLVLAGELLKATFLGPVTDCTVASGEARLQVQVPGAIAARRGEQVYLTVEPGHCALLRTKAVGP
ncbi:MAG TPA: ABC transporter ATP-binding protein [Candidatus Methylomirabilis sp.]|nr:ABC transporter ATP-binding protein [Candidatus Methylomirabilis sp.]HSC71352.1 ABC transporter ATP-binding protein [Candidatus Methylomirabilis sp.]